MINVENIAHQETRREWDSSNGAHARGDAVSESNGVVLSLPAPETDPRRLAYRIVGELIERHVREYTTLPSPVRVQLERIADAMRNAANGGEQR